MNIFRWTVRLIGDYRATTLVFLAVALVSPRSAVSTSHRSPLSHLSNDRAAAGYAPHQSHSIAILRRRLGYQPKSNRTLLFSNAALQFKTASATALLVRNSTSLSLAPTAADSASLAKRAHKLFSTPSPLPTSDIDLTRNSTLVVALFICSFCGFVLLTLAVTYLLRENINGTYFKLPCLHALPTTKESRASTPLFYSPIRSKLDVTEEFPVEQLQGIYTQKQALDNLAFTVEFKSLPHFGELPCMSATRTIVASKNRFLNILPIDSTRVVLDVRNNDPATDYINGNYISGYKCAKKFIATQGPTPDTCEDFWRMIWEHKLKSIVMLTNTIEGASRMTKCHQYWPELEQTITYGSYQITCIDRQCSCDYEKRSFQLVEISNSDEHFASSAVTTDDASSSNTPVSEQKPCRLIVQYHYTQWKDMDVPTHSHTLLQLIREVNEQTDPAQYPIVVHCTAGVGRTGTYISIDAMLQKIMQERRIDIYNFVVQMRRERHLMVQTVKQYVFIYRSLLEHYLFGNTRIEADRFRSTYANLKKDCQALLLSEYQKLSLLPAEHGMHHDAHSPENIDRNRCREIVPYDHNRVALSRILGHAYINASFVEACSRERSFIITQDPLDCTVQEFWRMFIEHDCNCIVQLHTFAEASRLERDTSAPCAAYYPLEVDSTMRIGATGLVQLLDEEINTDKFVIRRFYLTDTREALSKTVYHYEYLPPISTNDAFENGLCIPSVFTHHLFEFIGQISKRSSGTNQPRLVAVHCGNGGPTCSLFCLSVILLSQLKNEHAVDVFQCVRALQRQRPAMITSFAQYAYLYELIDKFLEEFFDNPSIKLSPSIYQSIYDNEVDLIRSVF